MNSDIRLRLFADSNVFIEGLFQSKSSAAQVIKLAMDGKFELLTCALVVEEVNNAIITAIHASLEELTGCQSRWSTLVKNHVTIVPSPPENFVKETFDNYMVHMRHDADIPILAAALQTDLDCILSGNRRHFNEQVSRKCNIQIMTCNDFMHHYKNSSLHKEGNKS